MPGEGAGIRFGQYVLLRRIARGGMAEVFLAQQQGLEGFDRRVAVKRILPHLAAAPDFVKMFLSEARLAAQLSHPNIVHIYDFGKIDGDYFLAMEYVEGVHAGELFQHGNEAERLSPTMVARLGADAAAALHHAHELRMPGGKRAGLVHRDVSPANLMVSFDGVVKLCDFGIAKAAAISDQLTNPGTVKGKYAYMSPEQTTGTPLDGRSDVYALAIVLWELLTGKTIVPRGDAVEAMRAIRDGKLTPITRAAPWTPAPLADAITWALQTKREQRPTAMQLAEALEAFIKSSPELATPMQLGGWLRERFMDDPSDDAETVPEGTEAVGRLPATPPDSLSAALQRLSDPRLGQSLSGATDSETVALPPIQGTAPALVAARVPATSAPTPITSAPTPVTSAPPAARTPIDPAEAATVVAPPLVDLFTPPPGAQAATMIAAHPAASTLLGPPNAQAATMIAGLRSGLGAQAASSSALAATVVGLGSSASAMPAAPAPTSASGTMWLRPWRTRRARAIAGLIGFVLVSMVLVIAARRPARPPTDAASAVFARAADAAPPDAPIAPTPQVTAIPIDAPVEVPVDAALEIVLDAAPTAPAGNGAEPTAVPGDAEPTPVDTTTPVSTDVPPAAMAALEIRTRPEGATIKIAGAAHPSPAEVSLPAGRYFIDAELDGWMPERRSVELNVGDRVVQEIVFSMRLRHGARDTQPGRLLARTTPASEVFLGTRRMARTPLDLELDPGTYTLVFKHPRRANTIKRVTISAGKTTKLTFALP